MDKLKMHSPDLVNANIERIAELFPTCVTESRDGKGELVRAIDFDILYIYPASAGFLLLLR